MATLKITPVIIPSRKRNDGTFIIYLRLIKDSVPVIISTDIPVLEKDFDRGLVVGGRGGDPNAPYKNNCVNRMKNDYETRLLESKHLLEEMNIYEIRDFLMGKNSYNAEYFQYAKTFKQKLLNAGKMEQARIYQYHLDLLEVYVGIDFVKFKEITTEWLEGFKSYLKVKKGLATSSRGIVLRDLRRTFNQAKRDTRISGEPTIKHDPFDGFVIEVEKSEYRDLSVDTVKKLLAYKPMTERCQIAKDIMILDLCLLGINLSDLWSLKWTDLKEGRLKFKRHKTGRPYNILVEPEAMEIIERYKGVDHLLYFAETSVVAKKTSTRQAIRQWQTHTQLAKFLNGAFHQMQKDIGFETTIPFTFYSLRHTVATILSNTIEIGATYDEVSLALAHKNPTLNPVTGTYSNYNYLKVDLCNARFLEYIGIRQKIADPGAYDELVSFIN